MKLLPTIRTIADLKALPVERLAELAAEIRAEIVATVARHGGHLSSNLGTVELSVALAYVFDPPSDKILFDVSHQAYAWKILTGRADRFSTLRRTDGLSGFQKRSESPCDPFGSGHAGNAISGALGLCVARDRAGGDEEVVAVVGDASIANGVSLEALDNVRNTTDRLLLVLNDNEMSIGRPVGAFSRAFARILASPGYNRWKSRIEAYGLRRLRMAPLRSAYHALESRVKSLFLRRANTPFESLGIRYVGPLDGHDVAQLVDAFRAMRGSRVPTVMHVHTCKGRGFGPAERDPEAWHSAPAFDPETGARANAAPGTVSWSAAFGDSLCELAAENPAVFALTAGMTSGTGLSEFAEKHPNRFLDVGICEEHQATFAAGLAAGGLRPVVAVYSTFFQRSVDAAIHDIALQELPVVFAFDRAGVVPPDGPTHHGIFDMALLRSVPGYVVAQPRTPAALREMLSLALRENRPFAIRYPRGSAPDDRAEAAGSAATSQIQVGRAAVVSRHPAVPGAAFPGAPDSPAPLVAIWTLGPQDDWAGAVAAALSAAGVASIHVDARFVRPLDANLLRAQVSRDGVALFASFEDASVRGGLGDAMRDVLDELGGGAAVRPLVKFGWPADRFVPHASSRDELLLRFGIDPASASRTILETLEKTK